MDIMENDTLISWNSLSTRFDLPNSQIRTYNLIKNACASLNLPRNTKVDSHHYLSFRWRDGTLLTKIKAKDIYKFLNSDTSVTDHINKIWYCNLNTTEWQKSFDKLWKYPIPPKVKCFKWHLLLDKLPVRNQTTILTLVLYAEFLIQ